jgi:hypothetical protein
MIVRVRMLAFREGAIREVQLPDEAYEDEAEWLEAVFYFGQNDFQLVKDKPSVSVGDVIEARDGGLYMVVSAGFRKITEEEYQQLLALPQRERTLRFYV